MIKVSRRHLKKAMESKKQALHESEMQREKMRLLRDKVRADNEDGGDAAYLHLLNPELYIGNVLPPDIFTFVDDPFFFGGMVDLQLEVRNALWDSCDPSCREVDMEIGKGSGKSEIAKNFLGFLAMQVLLMKDPHTFFGLSQDTEISLCNVSISGFQAKVVIYNGLKAKILNSEFFMNHRPVIRDSGQFGTPEIRFPSKNVVIYCGHSGSTKFLGVGTIGGVVDEGNYLHTSETRETAQEMYQMLGGSMKTRFPYYYKMMFISSVLHGETWMHRRFMQAKKAGKLYVRRLRVISAKKISDVDQMGQQWVELVCDTKEKPNREQLERSVQESFGATLVGGNSKWEQLKDGMVCKAQIRVGKSLNG